MGDLKDLGRRPTGCRGRKGYGIMEGDDSRHARSEALDGMVRLSLRWLPERFRTEDSMKVIIPTAGRGTRLRPHTYSKPKPLISVAGKPILGHILDTLSQIEVDEFIFITGYLGDQIETYVRDNYP